jgi:gas vesicle protein
MQDIYGNEQDSGGGAGGFVFGMLCGAAIGAAIGLMFAPRAGAETRAQLATSTERLRRTAAEQGARLRDRANDMYGTASETINDVVARGREAFDVGRDAFQRARPNGQTGTTSSSTPPGGQAG